MVGLHILAILGAYKSGNPPPQFPTNLRNFELFIYDLLGFLAYNFILILGAVFLFKGLKSKYGKLNGERLFVVFIIMYLFFIFITSTYLFY